MVSDAPHLMDMITFEISAGSRCRPEICCTSRCAASMPALIAREVPPSSRMRMISTGLRRARSPPPAARGRFLAAEADDQRRADVRALPEVGQRIRHPLEVDRQLAALMMEIADRSLHLPADRPPTSLAQITLRMTATRLRALNVPFARR